MRRKLCFIAFLAFLLVGNVYLFADDEVLRLELNELKGRLDVMAQNHEELMNIAEMQRGEIQLLRETRMSLTIGLLI